MRALNKFYFEIYDQDALLAINDFMKKFNVKNQALKHKNIPKKQSIKPCKDIIILKRKKQDKS